MSVCPHCVTNHLRMQQQAARISELEAALAALQPDDRQLAPPTLEGHRLFIDWLRNVDQEHAA